MAARKKTNVPAKATESKALAAGSWEDRMKAMAESAGEREPLTGGTSWLSVRNGDFHYGDEVLGDVITVVVLDFAFDNAYYDGAYDPDRPASPVCFALGFEEGGLVPHENATDPQADACDGCWANEFGSDDRGRGKACKNSRRLAVIAVDPENDYLVADDSELAFLRLPPSSLKYWKSYVTKLARVTGLPPAGVVTQLELEPIKGQSGSLIKPVLIQEVGGEESRGAILEHLEKLGDDLLTPYKQVEEEAAPPPRRVSRRAPAKKAPAKKAAATEKPSGGGAVRRPRRKF